MANSTRKNTMYNMAYLLFSVLLPLATAPCLSRTVGTDGVGLYSHAWSVSYIFCLIGMLGLNDYGVRAIARVRDNREELDRTFSGIWQSVFSRPAGNNFLVKEKLSFLQNCKIELHIRLINVSVYVHHSIFCTAII